MDWPRCFRDHSGEALANLSRETRIRLALTELGPTFIKLGQVLSTRPDLVGMRMAEELQQLQTRWPPIRRKWSAASGGTGMGKPIDELFPNSRPADGLGFDRDRCIARDSESGEAAAVKVQHADIQHKSEVDLDILVGVAQLAERIPEFRNFRPEATAAEFRRVLHRELDFTREQRNMQQFARDFAGDPTRADSHACTPHCAPAGVLTMGQLEGIKLSDLRRTARRGDATWRKSPAVARHVHEDDLHPRLLPCRSASGQLFF